MSHADFEKLTQAMTKLYEERCYDEALALVDARAGAFPDETARITLWRACLLSVGGHHEAALDVLREALDGGLWWKDTQFRDTDFDPIRERPEFKELVARSQHQYEQAAGQEIFADREVLVPDTPAPWPLLIALHGRGTNKSHDLEWWEAARKKGWLVVAPQSTQPLFPGAYCWDDPQAGVKDIKLHVGEALQEYQVDPERTIIGGFSQGAGMALLAALRGEVPVRGFIGVAAWWGDLDGLAGAASKTGRVRSYFVTGLKDGTLERIREIQAVLGKRGLPYTEEVHEGLAHAFPGDFGASFDRAADFLLAA